MFIRNDDDDDDDYDHDDDDHKIMVRRSFSECNEKIAHFPRRASSNLIIENYFKRRALIRRTHTAELSKCNDWHASI